MGRESKDIPLMNLGKSILGPCTSMHLDSRPISLEHEASDSMDGSRIERYSTDGSEKKDTLILLVHVMG